MVYFIAQLIGIIAFLISLMAYHRKNKKSIFTNMIVSNVLNIIHYLLLGAYSGSVTKILAVLRDSFIIYKDKNKKINSKIFLFIFIILYLICTYFTYDGILSIFPLLAAVIYLIFIWNGDECTIRKTAFCCYFLWLIYNIFVLSIAGIISNVVSIISTYIAIKRSNSLEKIPDVKL